MLLLLVRHDVCSELDDAFVGSVKFHSMVFAFYVKILVPNQQFQKYFLV